MDHTRKRVVKINTIDELKYYCEEKYPVGALMLFVDVRKDTYNIDCESLVLAVEKVFDEGKYKPKAVVAVDLFGQPFDYDSVKAICEKYNMLLL